MLLSGAFRNDIEGNDTNLIPVVIIKMKFIDNPLWGIDPEASQYLNDNICISTNDINIDTVEFLHGLEGDISIRQRNYKPLLLNIPSIRQSVDVYDKRFRVSTLSLDISNQLYNNKRIS